MHEQRAKRAAKWMELNNKIHLGNQENGPLMTIRFTYYFGDNSQRSKFWFYFGLKLKNIFFSTLLFC